MPLPPPSRVPVDAEEISVLVCLAEDVANAVINALASMELYRAEVTIESEERVPELLARELQHDLIIFPADLVDAHRVLRGDLSRVPAAITIHDDPNLGHAALAGGATDSLTIDELQPAILHRAVRAAMTQAEQKRRIDQLESAHRLVLAAANDGMWEWDLSTDRVSYSSRWKSVVGLTDEDVTPNPQTWYSRVHPDDIEGLRADLQAHLDGKRKVHEFEFRIRHRNGAFVWVKTRGLAMRDDWGRALRISGSLTDINRRKQAEAELHHSARRDALTGLATRRVLVEHLDNCIERHHSEPEYGYALLFLNLDRFRVVNESIGAEQGDRILSELAERLESACEEARVICRYGGDEFAILLSGLTDLRDADRAAQRIHDSLRRPFDLDGNAVFASVSIGVATSAQSYQRPAEVLRDVALATRNAKRASDSGTAVFEPEMRRAAVSTHRLQNALRLAVQREEFVVYYQPIVNLATRSISGFEALVRWKHPTRGLVGPVEFIPAAEETGLILPMGRLVLEQACRQMAKWRRELPAAKDISVSVNLSGLQLSSPGLIDEIERVLDEAGLDPVALKLELTESTLIDEPELAVTMLDRLRERGVRIYIDDFGTGYASLSYLHRFAIDGIKIDKSFVAAIAGPSAQTAIVASIVGLAHNLGVGVVAEGVEEESQAKVLRRLACSEAQGYLFSRPAPADVAEQLIIEFDEASKG